MSIDIWTDSMQHAELFGKPVLFTNWLIQRDTIPQGWHCYDLRGTRKAPNARITLVDQEAGYHAGTVLSPTLLKREGITSRPDQRHILSAGRGNDAGAVLRGARSALPPGQP